MTEDQAECLWYPVSDHRDHVLEDGQNLDVIVIK
jgi:hypothetical protein